MIVLQFSVHSTVIGEGCRRITLWADQLILGQPLAVYGFVAL